MFDMLWNREPMSEIHLLGYTDLVDDEGYRTGEKVKEYSEPVDVYARITPARGTYLDNVFGSFEDYTHIIIAAEPLSIVKDSILYYPAIPKQTGFGEIRFGESQFGGTSKFTGRIYTVKRVAHDLNTYYYALESVNGEGYPYTT